MARVRLFFVRDKEAGEKEKEHEERCERVLLDSGHEVIAISRGKAKERVGECDAFIVVIPTKQSGGQKARDLTAEILRKFPYMRVILVCSDPAVADYLTGEGCRHAVLDHGAMLREIEEIKPKVEPLAEEQSVREEELADEAVGL